MRTIRLSVLTVLLIAALSVTAQTTQYQITRNIPYVTASEDAYRTQRCKLDMYSPVTAGFATVIFFHGGGLEGGEKFIPKLLKDWGVCVIAPNYRLSPLAKAPSYIEDAAEAVAWTVKHISEYGGDPGRIYVCGHSAGGYLTLMLALDKRYLAAHEVDADSIRGYVSFSGQTNTHYTIRKERHLDQQIPLIDQYAPLQCVRKLGTKLLLLSGDREMEMLSRYTENLHLQETLNAKGNDVKMYELKGFDHQTMIWPSCALLMQMILQDDKEAGREVNMNEMF